MIAMRLDYQKMEPLTVQNIRSTHSSWTTTEIRLVFPFLFMNNTKVWLTVWLGLVFPFLFFPFMLLNKYVRNTKVCLGTASHQQQESFMQVSHHQQRQRAPTEGEGDRPTTQLHNHHHH